jgi:hypothetical protein
VQERSAAFPVLKVYIKERDNLWETVAVSFIVYRSTQEMHQLFLIERLPVYYGQFVHRLHLASRVSD